MHWELQELVLELEDWSSVLLEVLSLVMLHLLLLFVLLSIQQMLEFFSQMKYYLTFQLLVLVPTQQELVKMVLVFHYPKGVLFA
jgi:hypothetical protein